MRGIKIPPQDFAMKMQGGGGACARGGGRICRHCNPQIYPHCPLVLYSISFLVGCKGMLQMLLGFFKFFKLQLDRS